MCVPFFTSHSLFLDIDDPAAYFLTVSVFSAHHHAMGSVQYSQCPLVRIMAKPPSSGGMGKRNLWCVLFVCVFVCVLCFSSFSRCLCASLGMDH